MIVDCISDLHGFYPELGGGDLLIVAGDLTKRGEYKEYLDFASWLLKQKYKKKILVAGNHDNWIANTVMLENTFPDCVYLCDSGTEFEYEESYSPHDPISGITLDVLCYRKNKFKIWGSPWTKSFPGINPHCKAFTVDTEEELAEKWALIPEDVDILITHSAPYGILDKVKADKEGKKSLNNLHDEDLYKGSTSLRAYTLDGSTFKNKKLHIFGHVHEQGGKQIDMASGKFVNACHVNERYEPVNKPIRIKL